VCRTGSEVQTRPLDFFYHAWGLQILPGVADPAEKNNKFEKKMKTNIITNNNYFYHYYYYC
jgi:hypothetical protein